MLLYFKWITKKALLGSTGNSVQGYEAAWMGGEFGEEWIHVYVWLRPFAVHLKLSQHCLLINYTPVQNFKEEKKKKTGNVREKDAKEEKNIKGEMKRLKR